MKLGKLGNESKIFFGMEILDWDPILKALRGKRHKFGINP